MACLWFELIYTATHKYPVITIIANVKRKSGGARISISIPLEMNEEIVKHPEVNWSAVAVRAFRRQIDAIKTTGRFEDPRITDQEAIERGLLVDRLRRQIKS